jgi:hypothetical protein
MPMRAIMVGPLCLTTRSRGFYGVLPVLELLIRLRKRGDVVASVFEGDECAAIGRHDRIVKRSFPAMISHRRAAMVVSSSVACARLDRNGGISLPSRLGDRATR